MSAPIKFTIPGEPRGWMRPAQNGKRRFDPKPNTDAKATIAKAGMAAMAGRKPLQGAVRLSCIFVHPWPKTTTRKRKTQANGSFKVTKPDTSNQIKLLEDALNGICWVDDNQIAAIYAEKIHLDVAPVTHVTIEPLWECDGLEVFA